ncbi:hypothetical protein IT882_12965 [Microbacterium schleiferi]|uniref:Uncharacterized protein n=1 Tax=Microbacterium schleiferi TaxID=69362 RepID=A0A7S8MVU0_9MICO|nr:hypothetical protein [Microbacterium schleiferi]QPE04104.1 hypothetical protein IT882_12965 [Microbacterium schleiferi]
MTLPAIPRGILQAVLLFAASVFAGAAVASGSWNGFALLALLCALAFVASCYRPGGDR